MEELGNWLYLIIIIIAGISSVIGSIKKKNKQEAEKRQPREIITEDWEDVFENSHETETRQPATSERSPAAVQNLHARQKNHFDYKMPVREPAYSSLSGKDTTENTSLYTTDDDAAITLEDLPTNTEEWRKAFIYNEIFKRQY